MESHTLRLGVACLMALSAAPSSAATGVEDAVAAIEADCAPARYCDALIEFLMATGGVLSMDTLQAGLAAAFGEVTARSARDFPRFLQDLTALGITPEMRDAVECELVDRICTTTMSDHGKAALLRSLAEVPGGAACSGLSEQVMLGVSSAAGGPAATCAVVHGAYQT